MSKVNFDYAAIPHEMQMLNQWCCFDINEDGKKIPYVAGESRKARVNKEEDMRSYGAAMLDVEEGRRDYLGFFMRKENGLIFFDLDPTDDNEQIQEQKLIRQSFRSFTEKSVSGEGLHIIAKGNLEKGSGYHNKHMGLFDDVRFILMTGDVQFGRATLKRANTKVLESFRRTICSGKGEGFDFDLEEKKFDQMPPFLLSLCGRVFGEKFFNLYDGRWNQYDYPSQSEADHALLHMLCDFTDSNELVRYCFAKSGLYRHWKGGEAGPAGYIDRTIKDSRSKTARDKAMHDTVKKDVANMLAESAPTKKKKSKKKELKCTIELDDDDETEGEVGDAGEFDYPTDELEDLPTEMFRELSTWVYKNSYQPVQTVSMMAALVSITMITQRSYMISKTGLNGSFFLIGNTGWGKESYSKGIHAILGKIIEVRPDWKNRVIGKFASGEAMENHLGDERNSVAYIAEAGAYMRKLLAPNRPSHIDTLHTNHLDVFMSTDKGRYWKSRKKAKKDEDVVDSIFRPALTIAGESTPEDMFGDITVSNALTGLLPRQLFVMMKKMEYRPSNWTSYEMPTKILNRLIELGEISDRLNNENEVVKVRITKAALSLWQRYEEKIKRKSIEQPECAVENALMNRSALKALRIAAALAGAESPHNPWIKLPLIEWCVRFVDRHDRALVKMFEKGEVGKGQLKQEAEVLKIVKNFCSMSPSKRRTSYRMKEDVAEDTTIVPYALIKNQAKQRTAFSNDQAGAITAIDKCITSLCTSGTLVRLTLKDCEERYGAKSGLLQYTGAE